MPDIDAAAFSELDAALALPPREGARLSVDAVCRLAVPDIDAIPVKRLPGKPDAVYAARIPEMPYHCSILRSPPEMDDVEICEKLIHCGLEVPTGLPEEIVARGARMVPLLGAVLADPDFGDRDDLDDWGVIHALHLLGAVGAPEGAGHVVDWLRTEPVTDFSTESVPSVLGRMGEGAIDAIAAFVADPKADDILRQVAAQGLVAIGRHSEAARPRVAAVATKLLRDAIAGRDLQGATGMVAAFGAIPDFAVREAIDAAFDAELVWEGIINRHDVARERASGVPWSFHAPDDEPMAHFSARNLAYLKRIQEERVPLFGGLGARPESEKKLRKTEKKRKDKRKQAKKARRKGRK